MIQIDGSQGEGGGQIVRSSLALAAVTKQPIKLTNIRAGRSRSGLMRQHLTAVKAAGRVCNAKIEGAEIGASELTFEPQEICGGHYEFRVGTAGSTSLIAQTVLPALILADEPSTVVFEGGTHNPWAPPFDFLQRSFLPQLERFGPKVSSELEAYGFFPAGGGKFRLDITPCKQLRKYRLLQRGEAANPRVCSVVSELPAGIAIRENETIRRKSSWRTDCFHIKQVAQPRGPGNVVMIELPFEKVCAMFTGFGRQGVKAEQIARSVYREAKAYLQSDAPVGEYLADQLLMPMGLAASQGQTSEFRSSPLSRHSQTHIEVLKMFLPIEVDVQEESERCVHVTVRPS